MLQRISFVIFLLLAIVHGASAQFVWQETHPSSKDRISYFFHSPLGISSFQNVVSVMGFKHDSTQEVEKSGSYCVWRSEDDGKTWREIDIGLPKHSFSTYSKSYILQDIYQVTFQHLVVIGKNIGDDSALYLHSFDAGKTWERLPAFNYGSNRAVHFSDTLNGVVVLHNNGGASQHFYTTVNGGMSFTHSASLNTSWGFLNCYSLGNGRFRGFENVTGKVYSNEIDIDRVDSTSPIVDLDEVSRYWFRGCEFSGDTIIAYGSYSTDGTFQLQTTNGVIARSIDAGKSWNVVQHFPEFYNILCGTTPNRDTVLVSGNNRLQRPLYLFSVDNGVTWRTDTLRMDSNYLQLIEDIELTDNGTPIAISTIMSPGVSPTIIARGERASSAVIIHNNTSETRIYPNPSSGIVNIQSIDKTGAGITVIDILGREVYRGKLSNEGTASLDLRNVPKGIYYIVFNHYGKEFIAGKLALTIE
jgi:hypothetical protein